MKTLTLLVISIIIESSALAQASKKVQVADSKTSSTRKHCHSEIHARRLVSEQAARYGGVSPSPPVSMAEASAAAP